MADPLTIDGREYPACPDRNLLEVCLSLGLDLPYFCWHPALGSVGACRQCAVKAVPGRGRCEGPARDGLHDAGRGWRAHRGRRSRGARLPRPGDRVADDQSSARLPGVRRGRRMPPAGHDGADRPRLPALPLDQAHVPQPGSGAVRRPRDEPLHHLLSLRAVLSRLCRRARPAGAGLDEPCVLRPRTRTARWRARSAATWSRSARPACSPTSTLERHYARKWDLQSAPSVCVHCALGCNIPPGERYGERAARAQPLQRRGQRLFPVRPWPLRLRLRQRRTAAARAAAARPGARAPAAPGRRRGGGGRRRRRCATARA